MKKYTPSIQNNNLVKEEILAEVNSIIYKLNKGKTATSISKDTIDNAITTLTSDCEELNNSIGTGKENLEGSYNNAKNAINNLKKAMEQNLDSRFITAVDDLSFAVCSMKDINNGSLIDVDTSEAEKLSWSKKKLIEKLNELNAIKEDYSNNERRLESEINEIEKDQTELESKMMGEDNERILNDLYRRITAAKSKIESLNIRRSNYSICFNMLEMIEVNISEIVKAGKYTSAELNKAKSMLNMNRIKDTVVNPEKAIPILRVIEDDLKKIDEKVKSVDEKVFNNLNKDTTISEDAMKYKEELLKKAREKASLESEKAELESKLNIGKTEQKTTKVEGE